MLQYRAVRVCTRAVRRWGEVSCFACTALFVCLYVCMLKCLGAVRPSASLICADRFVIGAVDQVCVCVVYVCVCVWGGQLMAHPCRMKTGEIIEVQDECMLDFTWMGGRGPGDVGPRPITEATASLSGWSESTPTCSPAQSGQNQLSPFLKGFNWPPSESARFSFQCIFKRISNSFAFNSLPCAGPTIMWPGPPPLCTPTTLEMNSADSRHTAQNYNLPFGNQPLAPLCSLKLS